MKIAFNELKLIAEIETSTISDYFSFQIWQLYYGKVFAQEFVKIISTC